MCREDINRIRETPAEFSPTGTAMEDQVGKESNGNATMPNGERIVIHTQRDARMDTPGDRQTPDRSETYVSRSAAECDCVRQVE